MAGLDFDDALAHPAAAKESLVSSRACRWWNEEESVRDGAFD